MKCPHCKKQIPMPTERQIEAYRLVHMHGDTQEQVSLMMGISQTAVSQLLKRLRILRPDLFDLPVKRITRKNTISFDPNSTYHISRQF